MSAGPVTGGGRRRAALTTCALFLAGCHDPLGTTKSGSYTISGSVAGLTGGQRLVLSAGGVDITIEANGGFLIPAQFASGSAYAVTVVTQPAGEQCGIVDGSGTVGNADVTNVAVDCAPTVADSWTWIGGPATAGANAGTYGTLGSAASANLPGARRYAATWTDASGALWLFGGFGYGASDALGGYLDDLWRYDPAGGTWTWVAGPSSLDGAGIYGTRGAAAAGNVPGARAYASRWIDASGNLWLFGGYGHDAAGTLGYLDDLWKFTPSTATWTWVGGSSTSGAIAGVYGNGAAAASSFPGSRINAGGWTDAAGNFWLFGGDGYDAAGTAVVALNDLWRYAPAAGLWQWVSGSSIGGAVAGVYGTQGSAAASNVPGARSAVATGTDASGNLWLFGGYGYDAAASLGTLNDLWQYSPATGNWTWVTGSTTGGAIAGVYGTQGSAAAGNTPGARQHAAFATDPSGRLWVFGGTGYAAAGGLSYLADLWTFTPATGQWTWIAGPSSGATAGTYGTRDVSALTNAPGARDSGQAWIGASGNLWLFGGYGLGNSAGVDNALNDLWEFTP